MLAACLAAVVWIAFSSLAGLPINASHALIGGFGGAAVARTAYLYGWDSAFTTLVPTGWLTVFGFALAAPLVGYGVGRWLGPMARRRLADRSMTSRQVQLTASAALSLSHGLNDAQTAMGLIVVSLVATGHQLGSDIPGWAALSSHLALGLGVLLGSRRVVRRVGENLTRLKLADGSAAQAGAAFAVLGSSLLGAPVSATHALAGAVAGVGSSKPRAAVRWRTAARIFQVWVLTFPASAVLGVLIYGLGLVADRAIDGELVGRFWRRNSPNAVNSGQIRPLGGVAKLVGRPDRRPIAGRSRSY